MTNMGNETPSRRAWTSNSGKAATRRIPAAQPSRTAPWAKATSVQQVIPIRTLPPKNMRSSKQEVYNTKMVRALVKEEGRGTKL